VGASLKQARLRAIQCAMSDPVSFAVVNGSDTAAFPDVAGWSARDSARRAVAEHLGWLREGVGQDDDVDALGRLLTAARAALFLQSVEADDPELALGVASVADRLDDPLALEVYEAYRAGHLTGERPPSGLAEAFRGSVAGMPAYAGVD
jgi:hypothetical protein